MHFRPKLANYHKQLSLINLQNQIENDEPVDTLYFGNKDITTAMKKLKAELIQALIDTNQGLLYLDGRNSQKYLHRKQANFKL